jgi:hypothetical protein
MISLREKTRRHQLQPKQNKTTLASKTVFGRSGGFSEKLKPDPIPNSAVNLLSADGTKSQDLGE